MRIPARRSKFRQPPRPLRLERLESRLNLAMYTVNSSGDDSVDDSFLTLREAVYLANNSFEADTITFAPSITAVSLTQSQLPVVDYFKTTIDGGGIVTIERATNASPFRIISVSWGAVVDLNGLTIKNGDGEDAGGGIYNSGNLTISNSTISRNSANQGGGIYNIGSLTLSNSSVVENTAEVEGGGIYSESRSSDLNPGIISISDTNLSRNQSGLSGGAIYIQGASLSISNSTLDNNRAQIFGGAIFAVLGTASVSNSTLTNNSAVGGGGFFHSAGSFTLTNSTLSGNSAHDLGGGIFHAYGQLTLNNSTITNNRAVSHDYFSRPEGYGGGIYSDFAADAFTTLHNSIVAGNFVGSGTAPDDLKGQNVDAASSHNLIGDTGSAGGLVHGMNGNMVGFNAGSILNLTLANNGGPSQTHALVVGSVAHNAGMNSLVSADVSTDQRGYGFNRFEGRVDIGAFEVQDSPPIASIIPPAASVGAPLVFLIQFNEPITGFSASDLLVTNGLAAEPVSGANNAFLVTVIPNGALIVSLSLPPGTVTDLAGNSLAIGSNLAQGNFQSSDVNRDTIIDVQDILAVIYSFNLFINQIPYPASSLPVGPPFVDATGDGFLDVQDILQVIFDFNRSLGSPEGEGETSAETTTENLPPSQNEHLTQDTSLAAEIFAEELHWLTAELSLSRKKK